MWLSFRSNQENCPSSLNINNKNLILKKTYLGGLIWATAVIDEEHIYVGSTNRKFYCLDHELNIKWTYMITSTFDSLIDSAAAIHPFGFIVIPGGDGNIHAVDSKTGRLLWMKDNIDDVSVKIHNTGVIVNSFEGNIQIDRDNFIYAGCDNDYMYCLNPDGTVKWKYKTNMMIWTCAAISKNTCYFGSLDSYIYAINKSTGKLIKRYNTGGEIKSSPLIYKDRIFIGNTNGVIICFSENLEHKIWEKDLGRNFYASPIIFDNNLIYVNNFVYALDIDTGHLNYKIPLYTDICSSPVILNNNLIIATGLGRLIAIKDAEIKAYYMLCKKNINASLSVTPTGNLIVGSYDGFLYSISLSRFNPLNISIKQLAGIDDNIDSYLEISDKKHIINLRLIITQYPNAAISYNSVKIYPEIPYRIETSADGNYINLIPKNWDYLGKKYKVIISGNYYLQSENWFQDRITLNRNKFEHTIIFETPNYSQENVNFNTLNIYNLYLNQPKILDTYVPAALYAQGFKAVKIDSNNNKFKLVLIPYVPDSAVISKDKSKYVELECESKHNIIRGKGKFEMSAMGGTIPFNNFEVFLEIKNNTIIGEFFGISNCLQIKGNGKSYSFSKDIVNQLCDIFMQLHAIGTFSGIVIS
jgi:outer membrane protein assembly factor BamB